MIAIKARKFDVLIAESTSRVARDTEDLAGICKRLKHSDIEFNTINQGVIDNMKAGLNGIIDSEFIKNLVVGIKRGQNGLVREGLFPGAVTYGYERVEVSPGIFKPAERVINKQHAKIIRRIFTEYANGESPRKIAAGLSLDGVPAPSGGTEWNHQSLTSGGGKKRGGILGNRLYIGELIWNQQFTVTDPDTGSESKRARPASEHTVVSVPHLRIIDQKLWDAAQAIRERRSVAQFGPTGKMTRRPVTARSKHLLAAAASATGT
jgi:site-specific DNA recombinase